MAQDYSVDVRVRLYCNRPIDASEAASHLNRAIDLPTLRRLSGPHGFEIRHESPDEQAKWIDPIIQHAFLAQLGAPLTQVEDRLRGLVERVSSVREATQTSVNGIIGILALHLAEAVLGFIAEGEPDPEREPWLEDVHDKLIICCNFLADHQLVKHGDLTPLASHIAQYEGWSLFNAEDDAYPGEIQRLDDSAKFADDEAAIRHVTQTAEGGSKLHRLAMALHRARRHADRKEA